METKKCITKYCRNTRAPGRRICHKCYSKRVKENNPMLYFFNNLRNNAKRRGKTFTLTLAEFRDFCEETGYMKHKGKTSGSLSIDRIKSWKGYSRDNIQCLSLANNTRKRYEEVDEEDCPF